jgi:L-ascorbate metabolism protein UlaG (beta-lactamase superfamily)
MLNRRKFLKNGVLAAIASVIFPDTIFSDTSDSETILEFKPDPGKWRDDEISVAWIGHSTILVNFFGSIILTDPVLLDRVGVYIAGTSFGPPRLTPPALSIDEIPKPDIILLSHAHMDHMDYPTLRKLTKKYPHQIDAVTAHLTTDVIDDLKWKSLKSMDWGDVYDLSGIKFTALEVKHFGWRFPWEKDRSRGYMKDGRSYNAYLIEKEGRGILFGGDTTMTDKLNVIADKNIDIALMPIGAYNPWKKAHCNPEEALQMADAVGAKYFIPMHCKTFKQGSEPFEEPIDWLKNSVGNYNIKLGLDTIGQTFTLS